MTNRMAGDIITLSPSLGSLQKGRKIQKIACKQTGALLAITCISETRFIHSNLFFMKNDPYQTAFGKAIMTGLFAGLMATLACFAFEIFYRYRTGYTPSEFINVSSIIFSVNLLLLLAGVVYYYVRKLLKWGDIYFAIVFILLTLFCIWKAEGFQRIADSRLSVEFSHLLSGTILIIGISAAITPILFHNKKFNELVL